MNRTMAMFVSTAVATMALAQTAGEVNVNTPRRTDITDSFKNADFVKVWNAGMTELTGFKGNTVGRDHQNGDTLLSYAKPGAPAADTIWVDFGSPGAFWPEGRGQDSKWTTVAKVSVEKVKDKLAAGTMTGSDAAKALESGFNAGWNAKPFYKADPNTGARTATLTVKDGKLVAAVTGSAPALVAAR